jgi:hypothetical protein
MTERESNAETGILWDVPRRDFGLLKTLLQGGVGIRGRMGTSVRDFLTGTLGISPHYVDTDLQTVFVDNHPADDLDAAQIRDGCTLALSGAMPGLVGATMRRGGSLARMREGITLAEGVREDGVSDVGTVRLKLFNQPLSDLVETIADRPLGIPRHAFSAPCLRELVSDEALAGAGEFVWLRVHLAEPIKGEASGPCESP